MTDTPPAAPSLALSAVGIVAIGRNEGERLRACLDSVIGRAGAAVYVDSGSTDDSIATALARNVEVVRLDLSIPFTAARARNAGVKKLLESSPSVRFIQFVDGDCVVVDAWLPRALEALQADLKVAVVCGRRRERSPDASVYNRLCDMEWDTPVGPAEACGGDALIRREAFEQVGGYDESLIAGEEPEMCLRLRRAGWEIHRIDAEMTLHDAQMTRSSQWWKRTVRSGHAYAEGRARHGLGPERYNVSAVRSIIEWAVLLPMVALLFAWFTWGASLALFGLYAVLWHRVRRHRLGRGDSKSDASLYASYTLLGKFAQAQGVLQYWWNRLRGRRTKLIEYKGENSPAAATSAAAPPTGAVKT